MGPLFASVYEIILAGQDSFWKVPVYCAFRSGYSGFGGFLRREAGVYCHKDSRIVPAWSISICPGRRYSASKVSLFFPYSGWRLASIAEGYRHGSNCFQAPYTQPYFTQSCHNPQTKSRERDTSPGYLKPAISTLPRYGPHSIPGRNKPGSLRRSL